MYLLKEDYFTYMKLSIIIPAFNVEKYIGKTIMSLIKQTNRNFELIIVDDGSIDETYDIAEQILKSSNIKYKLIRKENGGVSSARNQGIKIASGDYIMFLDGDDYVSEELVESILNYLNKEKYDVICWAFNEVSENKVEISNYYQKYKSCLKVMTGIEALYNILCKKSLRICMGSAIYNKKYLQRYGFRFIDNCTSGEDIEFIYKVLSRAKNVYMIDKVLTFYVQRKSSRSKTYDLKKLEAIYAVKRSSEFISNLSNPLVNKILRTLNYDEKIKIYLNFLQTVYNNRNKIKVKNILYKIDQYYPNLNQEMIQTMKNYKGNNIKIYLKIKMFLLSPELYLSLFKLKKRIAGGNDEKGLNCYVDWLF